MTGWSATLSAAAALGVSYGIVGVAVALVGAATRTLHLAVGAVATAGLTVALVLGVTAVTGVPAGVALAIGVAVGAGLSALLGPVLLARLPHGAAWVVGFVVAGAVIEAVTVRSLGAVTVRPEPLSLGGLDAAATAVVLGVPAALAVTWLLHGTRWGRRVRIAGSSPRAAERAGIRVLGIRSAALAVAGAAAVLAAALVAPVVTLGPAQSAALTVRGVAAAALLGRVGPAWALPGGVAIGLAEALATRWWPQAGGEVGVAVLVVTVLAVRGADAERAWGRAW